MPDDHSSSAEPAPPEGRTEGHRIRVLLPLPLPQALDYLVLDGATPPEPGTFVRVPLGRRNLAGVVWEEAGDELPSERLRRILEILPVPALRPELRRFIERVAAYTMTPPGAVLRMAMSVPDALQPPRPQRLFATFLLPALRWSDSPRPNRTRSRRRIGACRALPCLPTSRLRRSSLSQVWRPAG